MGNIYIPGDLWPLSWGLSFSPLELMFLKGSEMIDIFMIDPPWPKKKGGIRKVRPKQGTYFDYETLPVDNIFTIIEFLYSFVCNHSASSI